MGSSDSRGPPERMPIEASEWFLHLQHPDKYGHRSDHWICPLCRKQYSDLNTAVACLITRHLPKGEYQDPSGWRIEQPFCWCGQRLGIINPSYIEEFKRHMRTCAALQTNMKEAAVLSALAHLS